LFHLSECIFQIILIFTYKFLAIEYKSAIPGELVFDNVCVPKENVLPNIEGLKGPLKCLNSARYGIAWGVIGAAMDCYNTALHYSLERKQFNKPIASFQLQQKKLAEILTEITKAQLLAWRVGILRNDDRATPAQISMAKRTIYVNPDDEIHLRVIRSHDVPKNGAEWKYQIRPAETVFFVGSDGALRFFHGCANGSHTVSLDGKIVSQLV